MTKLSRNDLLSLEEYDQKRDAFRAEVMAHKKNRRVELGDHVILHFEDRMIMHYQVQEMLRAEKIFDARGIEEELGAYNPLIPDGSNFKATMMIQYPDIEERKIMLSKLTGIEDLTWVRVEGYDKVFAIADEDMERTSEEKTSAVHFLRFELTGEMSSAFKAGANLAAGIDHENYGAELNSLTQNIASSLRQDLD